MLREYEIPFVGLKPGIHKFSFEVDDKFFTFFENSPVGKGKVKVDLNFDKKNTFFLLNFQISGTVNLPCDRCSDLIDFPIDADYPIVVKFDDHHEGENDDSNADIVYISRSETHLNVAQLIYEFIVLSVPIGRIYCEAVGKKCNGKTLKVLKNLNQKPEPVPDPRWKQLKYKAS